MITRAHAAADTAAVTSISSLLVSLGTANEIAQLVASIIAIVAGTLAIYIYVQKIRKG